MRIGHYITGLGRALRGKSNADTPPHQVGGWEVLSGEATWLKADRVWQDYSEAQRLDLAKKHALVYGCIAAIADRVPEAPLEIGRWTKDGWEADEHHYLLDTLRRPNVLMSYADLISMVMANLLASGEAYLWEVREPGSLLITELWCLPSHWVTPEWTDNTQQPIARYKVQQRKGKPPIYLPAQDVTYIRRTDPANLRASLAPLAAAAKDVQLDMSQRDYVMEMLTNLQVPGLMVKGKHAFTPTQEKDLRAKLIDRVGTGKRGSLLIMGGADFDLDMMAPLKDLDWPGLSTMSESRICMTFKVPPIIVGARVGLEHSTYANYESALRHFYRGTMVPVWQFLATALARGLLWNEPTEDDKSLEMRCNTDDVEALQEEAAQRSTRAVTLLHGGVTTLGQACELAGVDAPEDEDLAGSRWMPMGMQRIDIEPEPPPPAPPRSPEEQEAEAQRLAGEAEAGEAEE